MKNLKQWLFVLMASFLLVTVATGCTNGKTENEEPETEETETEGTETEEETEEDQ